VPLSATDLKPLAYAGTDALRAVDLQGALFHLPAEVCTSHALEMFVVTEVDAAAIRAILSQEGELSAAIELRRRFPGIIDNAKARVFARSIAGWTPLPVRPRPVPRLRPRKGR
jgi:hypothetical protein